MINKKSAWDFLDYVIDAMIALKMDFADKCSFDVSQETYDRILQEMNIELDELGGKKLDNLKEVHYRGFIFSFSVKNSSVNYNK